MKPTSRYKDRCPIRGQEKEKYTFVIAGAFQGTRYCQYDYQHTDGTVFSTIAETLDECRKQRDVWLAKKQE